MRILSFNASNPNLDVCLADGKNVIAQRTIICQANESPTAAKRKSRQFAASMIIPTVSDLLDTSGWHKSEIEVIVVGIGPGSFTGIRIAVVTARTLAQALNLPLLGISEFECYAFTEQIKEFPALISLPAGKKQYYCAHIKNGRPIIVDQNRLGQYQVNWDMTTHYLTEQDFESHLVGIKQVIRLADDPGSSCSINRAVSQAMLVNHRIESERFTKQQLIEIFPYNLVKPLYIRNASITISSASRANSSLTNKT